VRQVARWVVALAALVLGHGSASAGRSFFGWLYSSEVMSERGVELQQWVYEVDDLGPAHARNTSVWWGPLIGVTDKLELALPIEFSWDSAVGAENNFTLQKFGIEARYRFVTQDPEEAPPFAPLVRVAAKREVVIRDLTILEGDLVLAYDAGPVQLLVDAGIVANIAPEETKFEARPGAGFSVKAGPELRFGGEFYGQFRLQGGDELNWAGVGPNMAWTHGRFWLSASFLVGVYHVDAAPRFMWGVAF
jgi:hypothetical protein